MPTIAGGHHVAFTVRDADRSAQWYEDLLGMQVVLRGDDEAVHFRVLAHPDSGWVVGVRQYPGPRKGLSTSSAPGLPISTSPCRLGQNPKTGSSVCVSRA